MKSFLGDTMLETPYWPVRIEALEVGDFVLCVDPKDWAQVWCEVTKVESDTDWAYLDLKFISDKRIRVNEYGPPTFYTLRGWVTAENLTMDDDIYSADTDEFNQVLEGLDKIERVRDRIRFYSVTLKDFKGLGLIANNLLVRC